MVDTNVKLKIKKSIVLLSICVYLKNSTSVIDLKEMKHLMNVNSEITEIPTCAAYT